MQDFHWRGNLGYVFSVYNNNNNYQPHTHGEGGGKGCVVCTISLEINVFHRLIVIQSLIS